MSKKSLVDSIEVKKPCSQDWNEMQGSDRVRFCEHCNLSVNNLSALTRKQAMRLVRESNGRICVHYVKNPVDNRPLFADKLYQITRRAGIAAGVLGASLSLSTLAYAQGEPVLKKRNSVSQPEISMPKDSDLDKKDQNERATASISGTITDSANAVVPNVFISLTNEKTFESFNTMSDEKGAYKFENLPAGSYKIFAQAGPGFNEKEISGIEIAEGSESNQNISLSVSETAVVNVTDETQFYSIVDGGISVIEYASGLHRAASNDDLEEVKNLIMKGENVNAKDENYNNITPLFLAVENGNTEIVETLLNFGAKVNARDTNKQTPLMRLDEDASPELVSTLFKYGAKVNLTDNDGNTALILAARNARPEVLQILLNEGAKLDAQNSDGQTALMEAADADNLENVRVLLIAGANVHLKNKQDETAWDLTSEEEIEQLLESYGAVKSENQ